LPGKGGKQVVYSAVQPAWVCPRQGEERPGSSLYSNRAAPGGPWARRLWASATGSQGYEVSPLAAEKDLCTRSTLLSSIKGGHSVTYDLNKETTDLLPQHPEESRGPPFLQSLPVCLLPGVEGSLSLGDFLCLGDMVAILIRWYC
jgi:hypothetical protein